MKQFLLAAALIFLIASNASADFQIQLSNSSDNDLTITINPSKSCINWSPSSSVSMPLEKQTGSINLAADTSNCENNENSVLNISVQTSSDASRSSTILLSCDNTGNCSMNNTGFPINYSDSLNNQTLTTCVTFTSPQGTDDGVIALQTCD